MRGRTGLFPEFLRPHLLCPESISNKKKHCEKMWIKKYKNLLLKIRFLPLIFSHSLCLFSGAIYTPWWPPPWATWARGSCRHDLLNLPWCCSKYVGPRSPPRPMAVVTPSTPTTWATILVIFEVLVDLLVSWYVMNTPTHDPTCHTRRPHNDLGPKMEPRSYTKTCRIWTKCGRIGQNS